MGVHCGVLVLFLNWLLEDTPYAFPEKVLVQKILKEFEETLLGKLVKKKPRWTNLQKNLKELLKEFLYEFPVELREGFLMELQNNLRKDSSRYYIRIRISEWIVKKKSERILGAAFEKSPICNFRGLPGRTSETNFETTK